MTFQHRAIKRTASGGRWRSNIQQAVYIVDVDIFRAGDAGWRGDAFAGLFCRPAHQPVEETAQRRKPERQTLPGF